MHASARVLDATPERDRLPPISNQQSAIKQSDQIHNMSPVNAPGQLHLNDPHHLHHNLLRNFTFTSTFCILDNPLHLPSLATCIFTLRQQQKHWRHCAHLRPPAGPECAPAAALLAPAILTDCYRHTTSTRRRTVTNTTTPESLDFPIPSYASLEPT
jgi:hypothetical protein